MTRVISALVLCLLAGCAASLCRIQPRAAVRFSATSGPNIAISWTAPTAFTDSNAIPATDAITYNLYGAMQGQPLALLQSGIATASNLRAGVTTGTHCYAVTAVVAAIESPQSAEACATVAETPAAPTNLTPQVTQ